MLKNVFLNSWLSCFFLSLSKLAFDQFETKSNVL